MKNITAQEIKDQSKQLCDLWAILIDGTPPVRDIRNWLLDYELAAIESALRVCSRFVARQPEPEQVPAKRKVKYLKGVLHKAKYEAQTPEEREQEVSAIRAAAGSRGAYVKWQKEKLAAFQSLLSVCHDSPSVASVCQSDGDGDGKSDEGNGDGTGTSKTVASPDVASLSSNSITNTEPRGSAPNPATGASRPPVPLGGLDSPAAKGKSAFSMPAIPYDEDDLPLSVADVRARHKDSEELATILHGYYSAREDVTIPRNWKSLWSQDLYLTLATESREDIEHAMEAADYESQREYNVTCRGFLQHFSVSLDKWKKANKAKAANR